MKGIKLDNKIYRSTIEDLLQPWHNIEVVVKRRGEINLRNLPYLDSLLKMGFYTCHRRLTIALTKGEFLDEETTKKQ